MAISEAFEIKNATDLSDDDLNGHIKKLKTKTVNLLAIADSGSPMSFLNKKNRSAVTRKGQIRNKEINSAGGYCSEFSLL